VRKDHISRPRSVQSTTWSWVVRVSVLSIVMALSLGTGRET
jgi:hypothetical protein